MSNEFKLGNNVYHKSDQRPMVVIAFGKPENDMREGVEDKDKVICRYFSTSKDEYVTQEFFSWELALD